VATDLDEVAALVAAGDERAAFGKLRARLGWPRGKELAAGELPPWLEVLGVLAARRGMTELGELAAAVVRDPDSPDRLYDLGYALIDAGAPAVAATVLWRCLALVGDSEEVVCELMSALETSLAYRDAFAILDEHAALRARSFLCQYLYAFNAAMTGQLAITRTALIELRASSPETEAMRATIAAICARADRVAGACTLDERDLRGWHYVLTGGVVMHRSPYGFDDAMRGRYAWLQDSLGRIAFGIARLAPLVAALRPPCVYAPPGTGHAIVARALAARFELPLAPWPAVGSPAPGVVALYDLADLDAGDLPRLVQRRDGQILFAHASPWTRDSPIAPDATTLLYQTLVPPWPADADVNATADALAQAAPGSDELEADDPASWDVLVARAWPLEAPATRSRLWAGGPVPSNRFE
jgi:hypothetical protein